MGEHLDDEKLETLRSWGSGLSAEGRDELRAAGKAILILIEEIERLQVDVWRHEQDSPRPDPALDAQRDGDSAESGPALESRLRERLRVWARTPVPKRP